MYKEKTKMSEQTLNQLKDMNGEEASLWRDYSEDLDQHDGAIADYDAYEAMDMGKTYDPVSRKTGNGLTDNMTATIYLERAARVAGQLPEGETQAFGKKDYGKGVFLDILRKNWIYPNANSQFSFLTKIYLWQYGSSEYNVIPMHYDINVNETTGYIGPDCWVWNPRNFIPQNGFTSITDMDHVHAISYKGYQFFKDIIDDDEDDTYDKDAINSILEQIKNKTKFADPKRDTLSYRDRMRQATRQVEVVTRFESGKNGRWITFLPEFGCKVIRNIKNPHNNGRIPFVLKRCIPKIDSYYGNGDFQRSMPMQFANDGLDNYYFQGIKVNLFPATMVNMQSAVRHTISNDPGSIWEFNGTPDAKRLETSTAGLSTYQAAKGMAKGAIQSIAGTTDTRSNAENSMDPGMGKTPKALDMIDKREATRDSFDRTMLEESLTELIDGFYSILPTITEKIPVEMFSTEIAEIMETYPDLTQMFSSFEEQGYATYSLSQSEKQIKIKVAPSAFSDIRAKFKLKPNSTAKQTREQQLKNMMDFWTWISSMPNVLQQYQQATGKTPDWEFVFGEAGKLMDLPFLKKMFIQVPPQPQIDPVTGQPMPMGGGTPAGQEPTVNTAPQAQPPQPQPVQPDPQMIAQLQTVSPQNPVKIGGQVFTTPDLALKAYEMLLSAGVPA